MSVRVHVAFNHLPDIAKELRPLAEQAVAKTALDLEGQAKQNIRGHDLIDTGYLVGSVHAERMGPARWRVVVGAFYGVFHEYGTRFLPARPFLIPAANRVRPNLEAAIRELLRRSGAKP